MKKVLSIILSLAMLLSMTAGIDFSALADTSGDYEYNEMGDGTAEITKYNGSAANVTIPSTLDGKTVTSIGQYAFENCTGLRSITIPDSVTFIVDYAFGGCTGLKSVTFGNGIEVDIGYGVFQNCRSLTSITIPDSVKIISDYAFEGCTGLTSITIPNTVTSIESFAFYGCTSLTSVTIPESVTSIREGAFNGCEGLTSVTIPESVTSIGEGAFNGCEGLTSINIPKNVSDIGGNLFENCSNLESITVDSNNKYYDSRNNCNAIIAKQDIFDKYGNRTLEANTLFSGCKNTSIPNSVTSIGYSAFENCRGLKSITISDSVTIIGGSAFKGCTGLTSVTIPENVLEILDDAFLGCKALKDVYLYYGVNIINRRVGPGNECLTKANIHFKDKKYNYNFSTDSYHFKNKGSEISKKYFTTLYGNSKGKLLYKSKSKNGKKPGSGGLCFGMAYTVASIYNGLPNCNAATYTNSANETVPCANIREIKRNSPIMINGNRMKVLDYIKYAYIYQFSKAVADSSLKTRDDIQGLKQAVANSVKDGNLGVTVGISYGRYNKKGKWIQESAHRVFAVGIEGKDVLINDSNNPDGLERITINDDGTWSYSRARKGSQVNNTNARLRYQSDYYRPYQILSTGTVTQSSVKNSADNDDEEEDSEETYVEGMEELDKENKLLSVEAEDYNISSANCTEIPLSEEEGETEEENENLYWLDENENSVKISGIEGESSVELAGENKIIGAKTESNADVQLSIDNGKSEVSAKTEPGAKVTITVDDVKGDDDSVSAQITGVAKDGTLTAAVNGENVNIEGANNATVSYVDDEGKVQSEVAVNSNNTGKLDLTIDENKQTVEQNNGKAETPVTPSKPAAKPAPKASNAKSAANPANNISAQIKTFSNISVKLNKVKKGKKSFTATWKKVKGVDGYQIQYSLKKNMKKSKKKTVKASKSKLTVKKLKKGKKYYVRIRTYKTINGKKVYGKWSAKKTVKIK